MGHTRHKRAQRSDFARMDDLFLAGLELFGHTVESENQTIHFTFDPARVMNRAKIAAADFCCRLFKSGQWFDDLTIHQDCTHCKNNQKKAHRNDRPAQCSLGGDSDSMFPVGQQVIRQIDHTFADRSYFFLKCFFRGLVKGYCRQFGKHIAVILQGRCQVLSAIRMHIGACIDPNLHEHLPGMVELIERFVEVHPLLIKEEIFFIASYFEHRIVKVLAIFQFQSGLLDAVNLEIDD